GSKLDPHDWHTTATAASIADEVLRHLPPCDRYNGIDQQSCGNIILLHDGGGNRAQTVKALPLIIQGVRDRGYQIVPVSRLMGKTRDQVMPRISANEQWSAWIDNFAFTALGTFREGIAVIFFLGGALMTARLLLVGTFAVYDRFRRQRLGESAAAAHF